MMRRSIVEVVHATGEVDGFQSYGGVRIVLECGHKKQWDGWFPVPVPRVSDLFDCLECVAV